MKKSAKYIIGVATLVSLAACDNIAEDERFIPVIRPAAKQTYVIQEFTGQRCVNCPDGAAILHQIVENYGEEAVIIVGLHPKDNINTVPRLDKLVLTSDLATVYFEYWGRPNEFPTAIINGTTPNANRATWSARLDEIVEADKEKDPCANIDLNAVYDPDTRELNVDYEVYFTSTYGSEASLVLWLCENDMVGRQYTNNRELYPTGTIKDYVHNHVLRTSLNGAWGEKMTTTLVGTSNSGSATLRLDEAWDAEHCVIVGYLFDSSSKLGLQGAQMKVPAKFEDNTGSEVE